MIIGSSFRSSMTGRRASNFDTEPRSCGVAPLMIEVVKDVRDSGLCPLRVAQ